MRKDERIFCLILAGLSLLLFAGSLFIVPISELTITSPGGYPILMGTLCLVFTLIICARNRSSGKLPEEKVLNRRIVTFILMLIIYFGAIIYIHFAPATLIFLVASIYYLKRREPGQAALIAYISTFMIVLIFKYIFRVILP